MRISRFQAKGRKNEQSNFLKEKSDNFIVNEIPIPPVQGKQFYNGYNLRKKVSTFTTIDKISSVFTIIPSDISFGRTVLVVLPACLEQNCRGGRNTALRSSAGNHRSS